MSCSPIPIETLYSTRVTVVPSTFLETSTRNGLFGLGFLGPETTQVFTRSTFVASQVSIPTSTIFATPSGCQPSSISTSPASSISHSSSLTLTVIDEDHSTTRTTTAPILSDPTESAGLNSSRMVTQQPSTSTLVTAVSRSRSTVYLTLTATFTNPVTVAVSTQTASLIEVASNNNPHDGKKIPAGPIAGGVVGGLIALSILGILSFCLYRNRKREKMEKATNDFKTVLGGGNLKEKRSANGGGSTSRSRSQMGGRFNWDDEVYDVDEHGDGIQVQMDGKESVEGIEEEADQKDLSEENADSQPSSLLDDRDWLPTNSNANSVSGFIHGSSAGNPREDYVTTSSALSRHSSDQRLLLPRPSVQKSSSSSSSNLLLSPQSNGPLTPTSPMSISLGEDPLSHANFTPTSPVYRTSSPPNLFPNGAFYPVTAPNTLGRADVRRSFSNSRNDIGDVGRETWSDGNVEVDGTRPQRETRPYSPPHLPMPNRTWSQGYSNPNGMVSPQRSSSNGGMLNQHSPLPRSSQQNFSNDQPPQKRQSSFHSSRPTSPVNNSSQFHKQRQSSFNSSRPNSPNGNGFSELPPSRYSHLDWPRPSPVFDQNNGSGKIRSSSAGLLPPQEDLQNNLDQMRSKFSTSPSMTRSTSSNSFSIQSSKSNSPNNSRPSSRAMTGSVSSSQLVGNDRKLASNSKDDEEVEEDSKDSELWLDARE